MNETPKKKHRNTPYLVEHAGPWLAKATAAQLMHVSLQSRRDKEVTLPDGREAAEFVNCSYLGLDLHPAVIAAAGQVLEEWGVHFCCARSRFSIGPHEVLEEGLSSLFRGRAITFPSVTTTHMSVLPLLASGVLFEEQPTRPVRMIFDQYAHASMQYLKPILAEDAQLAQIPHNDLDALRKEALDANAQGQRAVYLADGVYSMGGMCPVDALMPMSQELGLALYIDDAHGTSIFGDKGEGYVLSQWDGPLPANVFVNFSLAKGFGCNGGGIVVPDERTERLIRHFGQTYIFSAPLDFSLIGAALASLDLHLDGTVKALQKKLCDNINTFLFGASRHPQPNDPMATFLTRGRPQDAVHDWPVPIQMVFVGETEEALAWGEALLAKGFFVTTAFFPVVSRKRAQLRIAITANHSEAQLLGLREALDELRQARL